MKASKQQAKLAKSANKAEHTYKDAVAHREQAEKALGVRSSTYNRFTSFDAH